MKGVKAMTFRPMRRHQQQLPHEEAVQILQNSTSGVLALLGDGDYPYAVPMSHFYTPERLYFHGAVEGHKVDAIRRHGKASFCVVAQDDVKEETFTTHFCSVIAFGSIRIVEDEKEKRTAITALAQRFSPGRDPSREIAGSMGHMHMLVMDIEHLTGKEAKELMMQRKEHAR